METQEEVQKGLAFVHNMAYVYAITGGAPTKPHKDLLDKIQKVIATQPKHEHDRLVLEIMMEELTDASGKEYGPQVVEALLKGFYDAQNF